MVDDVERTIDENLKKAGGLRQSILKKAFAGELVPREYIEAVGRISAA